MTNPTKPPEDAPKGPIPASSALPSARPQESAAAPLPARPQGNPGGKPLSAREMSTGASSAPLSGDPDTVEGVVSVDDTDWIVRVLGRSGAPGAGETPLLLLGFWASERADGDPERESLVVGTTLAGLTPDALAEAFRVARVPIVRERPQPERKARGRRPGRPSK